MAKLPEASQIPDPLKGLLARQTVFIRDNDAWPSGVTAILREVDRSLHGPTLHT